MQDVNKEMMPSEPINLTDTNRVGFREFRKTSTIKAGQIGAAFIVDTLEGTFEGKAGDWLVEGIDGERYIIDDAIFQKTYEEVDHAE